MRSLIPHATFFLLWFLLSMVLIAREPQVRRALFISAPTHPTEQSNSGSSNSTSSDIRLAPSVSLTEEEKKLAQLLAADRCYDREEFSTALLEYQRFLQQTTPHQAQRNQALFRLAECQRKLGQKLAAEETYRQLLEETPSGIFAAGAAYRLGESYQARQEKSQAALYFAEAASLTNDPKVKNAARYAQALCYDQLGEEEKAMDLLKQVAQEESPSRFQAKLALAYYEEKKGHLQQAEELYESLGKESSGIIAAEGLVRAAMMNQRLGKKEEAERLFHQVTSLNEAKEWSDIASLGLMRLAFEKKDYQQVINNSEHAILSTKMETKAQALLLTAQAAEELKNFKKTSSLCDRLIQEVPDSEEAKQASLLRLKALRSLEDPKLLQEIEIFLSHQHDLNAQTQALLLKAEALFQLGNYSAAAETYDSLSSSNLSTELKSEILYKEAWSWSRAGEPQKAFLLLSTWIKTFPQSPQMPLALLEHARLAQERKDIALALADYTTLIKNYPKSQEGEIALLQKALLHGELQENKEMRATFQELLASYPQTSAAAQANFWIGWTAFETKDYKEAIPFLEKARLLNKKELGERATLRLLLAHYYLGEVSETNQEAITLPAASLPLAIAQWLGLKLYEQGKESSAEQWLSLVMKRPQEGLINYHVALALTKILLQEKKFQEAREPAQKALELSRDPAARAEATMALATLEKGLKNYSQATSLIQETLLLQPEGAINIKARLLLGDLLFSEQEYDAALKSYQAVTLLTEDHLFLKEALQRIIEIYEHENNQEKANKAREEYRLLK